MRTNQIAVIQTGNCEKYRNPKCLLIVVFTDRAYQMLEMFEFTYSFCQNHF